jgi:hypothetical protein
LKSFIYIPFLSIRAAEWKNLLFAYRILNLMEADDSDPLTWAKYPGAASNSRSLGFAPDDNQKVVAVVIGT